MPITGLAAGEAKVVDWLATQREAMLALLQQIVNIDSGSYDKSGVDAVGERLKHFFAAEGLTSITEPHETCGEAIHVRLDATPSDRKQIVLMGHRDTVFPRGEARARPFRIENWRAYGPGVADMKGGLVMNAFVLAALRRFGGAPAPLAGLITGDEEIASPSSRAIIERVARQAHCVLNSEPGRASGNIVTGRKGGVFLHFEIFGRAAHSGGNFENGVSAIGELAHKVLAMHALTGSEPGITVNVGLLTGGQSVNTTAPHAEGQIDLRYVGAAQRAPALAALQAIIDRANIPATKAKLSLRGEFLPLARTPQSEQLFSCYRARRRRSASNSTGNLPEAAPIPGLRRASAARRCAALARWAHMRTPRRSTWRSRRWCRARRRWRWQSCACRNPPATCARPPREATAAVRKASACGACNA